VKILLLKGIFVLQHFPTGKKRMNIAFSNSIVVDRVKTEDNKDFRRHHQIKNIDL
jgi:hypothetical protein